MFIYKQFMFSEYNNLHGIFTEMHHYVVFITFGEVSIEWIAKSVESEIVLLYPREN